MTSVTFVIPVFNKATYLKHVIKSIIKQKGRFEREFIFINDGSTDQTLQYLKKITKKWKNTKIFSQKNLGPAAATQKGIENSKGDYLKLVGGDDLLHPNCTNLLLNIIKKNKSVGVFSKYKLMNNYKGLKFKNEKPLNIKKIETPLFETVKSSFSGTSPNLYCNKSIKRSGGHLIF